MQIIRRYIKLPLYKKWRYIEICAWLGVVRIATFLFPFKWLLKSFGKPAPLNPAKKIYGRPDKFSESFSDCIRIASEYVPWECNCLVQTIAGKMFLKTRRISSTIYIGVVRNEENEIEAHAWLRCGKVDVTGGKENDKYSVLIFFT